MIYKRKKSTLSQTVLFSRILHSYQETSQITYSWNIEPELIIHKDRDVAEAAERNAIKRRARTLQILCEPAIKTCNHRAY